MPSSTCIGGGSSATNGVVGSSMTLNASSTSSNGITKRVQGMSNTHAYNSDQHCIASSSSTSLVSSTSAQSSSGTTAHTSESSLALHPILNPDSLVIKQTASAGRGVFAAVPLSAGTVVEVSHVLLFPPEEYERYGKHTQLDDYTYVWNKTSDGKTMALALGMGSLFNHSHDAPNVSYTLDKGNGTIRYKLTRNVLPDEELFISYGVGTMWWEKTPCTSKRDHRNGNTSSADDDRDDDDDSDGRLEDELMALSHMGVGVGVDENDQRNQKRREDRRRQAMLHASTPTPSTSTPPPLLAPPKAVGPEAAPLWRITAAVDPRTTALELMPVWAVDIDPRKSANFLKFSRSISRRLRAAEGGGDGQDRMGRERTQSSRSNDEEEEEDDDDDLDEVVESRDEEEDDVMKHLRLFHRFRGESNSLTALIARVQDIPYLEKVKALLDSAEVDIQGPNPVPFQIMVPKHPAPSRERLPEWKIHWPVAVKHGKTVDLLMKSSLSGSSTSHQGTATPGVVDRAADARLWTEETTSWAIGNFRRCLELAKMARAQGDLPVGVHVIPAYSDGGDNSGGSSSNATNGTADAQSWLEIDAWDTRQSDRNIIRHAVTNAIRDVATLRSDRDKERLQAVVAKVATLNRDPNADPQAELAIIKADDRTLPQSVSGSSTPLANNQDYLLNNLTLFTTHEPCMYCCMALVHSRVRSIFFIKPSPGAGGCCGSGLREDLRCAHAEDGGPYAVQEQAGLNHHFHVWKWVGDDHVLSPDDDLNELLDIGGLDA